MTRLGAESWLAAGAIWLLIMLPSAAFGAVLGGEPKSAPVATAAPAG